MKLKHYWKKAICVGTAVVLALGVPVASMPIYAADADVVESAPEIAVSDVAENETDIDILEDTYEFSSSAIDPNDVHDQNLIDNNDQIVEDAEADIDTEVADDSIGEELVGASYTSGQWTYTISNFESEITAYSGNSGNVSIPSSLGGYPVTKLARYVFEGKAITGITIPSSVEFIGHDAFTDCKYLTTINYNAKKSTVETWNGGPFLNAGKNSGGVTVTFGSGVTNIPASILYASNNDNRPRIKSVSIPSSATEIGNSAFDGCSELTSVSMGSGIVTIGRYAFTGTRIKTITIPAKVERINHDAFTDCKYLTTINYNAKKSTVETWNGGPFLNAGRNSGGVTVTFGSGVTIIPASILYASNNDNRPRIKSVSIPSSVTEIGNSAFDGCSELTSVSMGSSIVTIGRYAFTGTGIKTITIPAKVERINHDAFTDCKYLTTINYNAKKSTVETWNGGPFLNAGKNSGGVTVTFGSGVTNIPASILYASNNDNRPRIKSVSIPSSVTEIGNSAFDGCSELTSVSMGSGIVTIGRYAFTGTGIKTITIPAKVERINHDAFTNCKYLTTINYNAKNSTVETWNGGPFLNAGKESGGVTVKFGSGVTVIPNSLFDASNNDNRPRLKSVAVSSTVKTIGDYSFEGSDITSITIPASVTNINNHAFANNSKLTTVKIYNKNAAIHRYAFDGCPSNARFYIYKNGTVDTFAKEHGFKITYLTSKQFSDVQDPTHAYYNAIYWAANAGITNGYPDGTFGINRACTRGEMIMFLWRYAGKPSPKAVSASPFKDVAKTHAYYNAILWASQKGITKGYPDGTFGINRNVSRGQCMMFLWRLKGKPAPKNVAVSPFKDVPKSHAYYNAILWGYQNKITNGYTSGTKKGQFGINESCTRGAIVTFLYRAR